MKFAKYMSIAAASVAVLGASLPASANGLMNVISSSSTSINGTIKSTSTSWDEYAGAQITVQETSSVDGSLGANLTGLLPSNAAGGNLNLYGQAGQDFGAQATVTFFKGGDRSTSTINGHINQIQTSFETGVQSSFGN